jgi:hypothetical protein
MRSRSLAIRVATTIVRRSVLLARQQREAALVDALPRGVDLLVAGDHQVGERHVGVEQGRGGRAHLGPDRVRHLDETVPDVVELFEVALAHASSFRGA